MTRENNIINLIKRGFTKEQIKAEVLDRSKQEIEDFFTKLIPISQKIISLTLDGFSEEEISEILGISKTCVPRYLGCFINSKSSLYDKEIAQKILKLQRNKSIQKQLELYKKLMILDEKNYDLNEIAKNSEIKRFQKLKKRITGLKQFVQNGCVDTLDHLAFQCELNKSTISQILREKDDFHILDNFLSLEEKAKLMAYYERIKQNYIASRTNCELFNNHPLNNSQKENYSRVYKRINYWCQVALSYRLSLYNLCKILKYHDRDGLKIFLLANCPSQYYDGLKYLFDIETAFVDYLRDKESRTINEEQKVKEDDILREKYLEDANHVLFYNMHKQKDDEKSDSKNKSDEEKYQEIMRRLTDCDYKETIEKHSESEVAWSKEDIAIVVRYKIKYCLSFKNIPAPRNTIVDRCPEDLKEVLNTCNDCRKALFENNLKRTKKVKKHE